MTDKADSVIIERLENGFLVGKVTGDQSKTYAFSNYWEVSSFLREEFDPPEEEVSLPVALVETSG